MGESRCDRCRNKVHELATEAPFNRSGLVVKCKNAKGRQLSTLQIAFNSLLVTFLMVRYSRFVWLHPRRVFYATLFGVFIFSVNFVLLLDHYPAQDALRRSVAIAATFVMIGLLHARLAIWLDQRASRTNASRKRRWWQFRHRDKSLK